MSKSLYSFRFPSGSQYSDVHQTSPEPGTAAFADPIHRAVRMDSKLLLRNSTSSLLAPTSDHLAHARIQSHAPHLTGIADLINKNYGGAITKHYETA